MDIKGRDGVIKEKRNALWVSWSTCSQLDKEGGVMCKWAHGPHFFAGPLLP